MTDYIVYENQTLQDLSAHVYGRVDMVMELALLNNISLTDDLQAGQVIKMIDVPKNTLVLKSLESRKIIPASGFGNLNSNSILPTLGIGTMRVGTTFIVG